METQIYGHHLPTKALIILGIAAAYKYIYFKLIEQLGSCLRPFFFCGADRGPETKKKKKVRLDYL